ncbi:MAG: extracellular solute-binding protein [Chloroflexales bacterium]|nr:extracellular solute-binding protein [Chloroflexales bacterium]
MRRHVLLVAALIAATILSSCGLFGGDPNTNPDSNPNGSDGPVTIGFGAREWERSSYEALIEQFNTDNSDIRVQFVSLDEAMDPGPNERFDPNQMTRRIVSIADTSTTFFIRSQDMENGYFYDLTPLMEADPNFSQDDFYPSALGQVSHDGKIYALPQYIRIPLLSYNKDLWNMRGLAAPDPNWTWQDLTAAAEQLASKRGNNVDVYGLFDTSDGFMGFFGELYSSGSDILTTPPAQARLDTPEVEGALERTIALMESGALYKRDDDSTGFSSNDIEQLLLDQRIGMWMADMFSISTEQSNMGFEVGTLAFPDLGVSFLSGSSDSYVISSGTQHPKEAWRWLEFLSRQTLEEGSRFASMSGGQIPARRSIAESSGYWDNLDEETATVVRAALERPSEPLPSSLVDSRVSILEPLSQALNAVINENKPADEALRDAQARLDELIAEVQLTPQPTPDTGPIVVTTPVPDVAPEGATIISFLAPGFGSGEFRQIAREFNQNNTDVYVQLKDTNSFEGPMTLESLTAETDCLFWWGIPQSEEITATLDLQPLIDADPAFAIDDYPPAMLDLFREGTALHGLPFTVNFRVLNYNQTAFDAAGLDYPSADWTTDDLLAAAQQLTTGSGSNQQYGFVSLNSPIDDLNFILEQAGAEVTLGSEENIRPNYTDPVVIKAISDYVKLFRDYSPDEQLQGYKRESFFGGDSFQLVAEGRVGMWFESGFYGFGFSDEAFTIAAAPPPLGSRGISASSLNPTGLFISASTEKSAACWSWLKYLSGSAASYSNGFPARISVAESEEFAAQAQPGAVEVYRAYREVFDRTSGTETSGEPFYFQSQLDTFWLYRAIDRAIQSDDPPEDTLARELDEAQKFTEEFLACTQGGAEAEVCALQVDPTYEGFNQPNPDAVPVEGVVVP